MKATQDRKPVFDPITIILETYEEAEAFKLMANVSGAVSDAVAREISPYVVNQRRRDAIKNILFELRHALPFYNLELKEGN